MKRTGRTPTPEIVAAVAKLHVGNYTQTAALLAARGIRTTAATVHDVLMSRPGALSIRTENTWRSALGMAMLTIPTYPCPTCGQPHNVDAQGVPLDCHGKEGQAVWRQATPSRPARPRFRVDITLLSPAQQEQVRAFIASLKQQE